MNRYSKSEYSSSAAKFDEAFLSLDSFYRSSYGDIRNSSWNLKNLSSDPSSRENKLLAKAKLTVMDMILLSNRNPELLFKYTAGKELSEKDLDRALFEGMKWIMEDKRKKGEKIHKDTVEMFVEYFSKASSK